MTREKSPNVHKSCPKKISLEKLNILEHSQKLPKTVGDLGKLIVAKGFKKLPKVQKIAKSGHTECSNKCPMVIIAVLWGTNCAFCKWNIVHVMQNMFHMRF